MEFHQALDIMNPINIDKFLLYHTKYQELGKIFIKLAIASKEDLSKFRRKYLDGIGRGADKDLWYRYFIDAIINECNIESNITGDNNNPNPIMNNNVNIVTFNYDVSLDYYRSSPKFAVNFPKISLPSGTFIVSLYSWLRHLIFQPLSQPSNR